MQRIIIGFLIFLLSSNSFSESSYKKADELVDKFFEKNAPVGLSLSVGREGAIIWSKGLGYSDLEQHVPVMPSKTKFRVANVAKPFTAYALLKLVEESKINLDAEIQTYVPSFPKKEFPITVRQLATHLSGIRHYSGDEAYSNTRYESVKDG